MARDPFAIMEEVGAIVEGHFMLTSGRHADRYMNKDGVYVHTAAISELCLQMAGFSDDGVQTVVGPEKGGIILSQWTAHHLSTLLGREVLSAYAEKDGKGGFVFNRLYYRLVKVHRVLIVEDVITTGGSVEAVVKAVRALEGTIVGVSVLCNRSGLDAKALAQQLEVPWVHALTTISKNAWPTWKPEECLVTGPCSKGIPISTDLGKGKEFLASKT